MTGNGTFIGCNWCANEQARKDNLPHFSCRKVGDIDSEVKVEITGTYKGNVRDYDSKLRYLWSSCDVEGKPHKDIQVSLYVFNSFSSKSASIL